MFLGNLKQRDTWESPQEARSGINVESYVNIINQNFSNFFSFRSEDVQVTWTKVDTDTEAMNQI